MVSTSVAHLVFLHHLANAIMGRPPAVVVSLADVVASWSEWLRLKNPGFTWDASSYARPSRNQSADLPGLREFALPLAALLKHARTGFPTHSSLRDVFVKCDEEFNIFESCKNARGRQDTASKAADIWRKMCRDVYSMAKAGVYPADLKDVVALIDLSHLQREGEKAQPTEANKEDPAAIEQAMRELANSSVYDLSDVDGSESGAMPFECTSDCSSGEDVVIMNMTCTCVECRLPVPSAVAGGQRCQSSLVVPPAKRMRIRVKTKTSLSIAAPQTMMKARPKPKTKAKRGRDGRANPRRHEDITLPVSIVTRATKSSRPGGTYMLQNVTTNAYVIGVSAAKSPNHRSVMEELMALVKKTKIKTPSQCQQWIDERLVDA